MCATLWVVVITPRELVQFMINFLLHNDPAVIGSNKGNFHMISSWSSAEKGKNALFVSADVHVMTLKSICIRGNPAGVFFHFVLKHHPRQYAAIKLCLTWHSH